MSVFKTEEIKIDTVFGAQYVKVKIMISSQGLFYANIEDEMHDAAQGALKNREDYEFSNKGQLRIISKTYEDIIGKIKRVCKAFLEPQVTKIPVIRYNIESHVAFAQDKEGGIYPNARYPGSKWPNVDSPQWTMFGGHSSSNIAKGGYSLTVGAIAQLKTIYKYGDKEKIEYSKYYGHSNYPDKDNPAERLNSWCSFDLGYSPKEIPYTDEAAEFFYNLMYGIAKLSKMIQESTFEQTRLLQLIANSTKNLLPSNLTTVDASAPTDGEA